MAQAESPFGAAHPRIQHSSWDCLCSAFSALPRWSSIPFVQNNDSDSWCSLLFHPPPVQGPADGAGTFGMSLMCFQGTFPHGRANRAWTSSWARTFFLYLATNLELLGLFHAQVVPLTPEHLKNIFRTFMEHLKNIFGTFVEHLKNIFGSGLRQGVMADGSSHPLPWPQRGERLIWFISTLKSQIFEDGKFKWYN